jgi:histidinol-phosphatase (PHP family)
MLIDLHNHTSLCNHASGTTKEYINKAIKQNIKVYGFSDHAPMNFDPKYRMKYEEIDIYENMILSLTKEYKNEIDIKLAYEVDFIDKYTNEDITKRDVDYLIGSVHFINEWGFDNPTFIGEYKNYNIDELYSLYFLAIENMAKSNLFHIVGHLDLIKVFNKRPTKDIRLLAKNTIKAIKDANMVVEINTAGFRKEVKEQYPCLDLLSLIYENNINITFSSDAHKVDDVGNDLEKAQNIAKNIGFSQCAYFSKKDRILVDF